jgi:SAM-dependent methyltransferase
MSRRVRPLLGWLLEPGVAGPWRRTRLRCHVAAAGCSVCGTAGPWAQGPALGDDLVGAWGLSASERRWFEEREGRFCGSCGASLRVRMLVFALYQLLPSLSGLAVLHVNEVAGLGRALADAGSVTETCHRPGEPLGNLLGHLRNEDLTRLSFPDASFDLVVHSETLEHIDDYPVALAEVERVLRPGGLQLYTVPLRHWHETRRRTQRGPDGRPRHLLTPSFHGCGGEDLVYWEFGGDFLRERGARISAVFYDDFFRNPTVFAVAEVKAA